jgi:DHA2 family multidrug resistance protein
LISIPREELTSASGIYTLFQRIGGNVGYAFVATILERRSQFHRVHLIENISLYSPAFQDFYRKFIGMIAQQGLGPVAAQQRLLEIANRLVDRQAAMLGYNDVSWILAMMFIGIMPLVFFLPSKRPKKMDEVVVH